MKVVVDRKISDYFTVGFTAILVGFTFSVIVLLWIVGQEFGIELAQNNILLVLAGVFIAGVYFFRAIVKWRKYDIWAIDNGTLHRGNPTNLSIPISEISQIRVGLPKLSGIFEFLRKIDSMNNYNKRKEQASDTLVLSLENNKLLPLSVMRLRNGELFYFMVILSVCGGISNKSEVREIVKIVDECRNQKELEELLDKLEKSNKLVKLLESDCGGKVIGWEKSVFSDLEKRKLSFSSLNKLVEL